MAGANTTPLTGLTVLDLADVPGRTGCRFRGCPVRRSRGRTHRQSGSRFSLVDPVDGTKEFVKRGGEFTVNIGEIENGQPVSGVVFAPAIGRLFVGAVGEGRLNCPVMQSVTSPAARLTRMGWWR